MENISKHGNPQHLSSRESQSEIEKLLVQSEAE